MAATRPGDTLAGRYRLDDLLSESGTGRFFLAHDQVLHRQVALHVISCADERAPGLLEAARRSATVIDARILRVLDAQMGTRQCFVVNEWGHGTSLDIALANNGPVNNRQAAWLVAEVADAVAGAHSRGVHHGRLVPENVLIDPDGGVRIIGYAVDAALHGLPPGSADQDVRDLAGLMHACLTGRWAGPSSSAVPAAPQVDGHPMRPRQIRAGVPRALDDLVDGLLNPDTARARAVAHLADLVDPADPVDAAALATYLAEFTGDPAGVGDSLAEDNPVRAPEAVVLGPVPEIPLRLDGPDPSEPVPDPISAVEPVVDTTDPGDPVDPGDPGDPGDTAERVLRPLFAPEPEDDERAERARAERVARVGEPGPGDPSTTGRDRAVAVPPRGAPGAPRHAGDRARVEQPEGGRAGVGWLWVAAGVALVTAVVVVLAIVWSNPA